MGLLYLYLYPLIHISLLKSLQCIFPCLRSCVTFHIVWISEGKVLLAPLQTSQMNDHTPFFVLGCLIITFAGTLHIWRPSPPSVNDEEEPIYIPNCCRSFLGMHLNMDKTAVMR
jgi:hypothetical protein